MLKSTDEHRAIACNFMHEPRISKERERDFLKRLGPCSDPEEFMELLLQYAWKHIQQTPNPDFKNPSNVHNRISVPVEPLVTILIVNGLAKMFLWARNLSPAEVSQLSPKQQRAYCRFKDYRNTDPSGFKFVANAMRGKAGRRKFLGEIFTLYDIYRFKKPYHPIWLTKWSDFRALTRTRDSEKANQWCHWVGVSTEAKAGQWVALLRFHGRSFKKDLYHPTVLDAGANVYHFPAPEGVKDGGRAADLQAGSAVLACEYIAAWPSFHAATVDFDEGCARLKPLSQKRIREIRLHHISRLQAEFRRSAVVSKWLKRLGNS